MPNGKKARLLCVDDEPLNIKLFEAIFPSEEYALMSAATGKEAWERIQTTGFDAILLDVMIPGMNGFELCKLIRENRQFAFIPVVFVTSLTDRKFCLKGIEAGADDFFVKPVDKEVFRTRVSVLVKLKWEREGFRHVYEALVQSLARIEDVAFTKNHDWIDPETGFEPHVRSILGNPVEPPSSPQFILLGFQDQETWRWNLYQFQFDELAKSQINARLESRLKPAFFSGPRLVYALGREQIKKQGMEAFCDELESQPCMATKIANLVVQIGFDFCIFAINYSSMPSSFEGMLIKSLGITAKSLFRLNSLRMQGMHAAESMVLALTRAGESAELEEKVHPLRVGEYCTVIAERLGMADEFARDIGFQARLHDIGNLLVPREILAKSGSLDFAEWEVIRRHTQFGAQIIGDLPGLKMAKEIALAHHENWDGSGYPNWLAGENIPMAARITAIADRYDVLRIERPYKQAFTHDVACAVIFSGNERLKPDHFDPKILDAFKACAGRLAEVFTSVKA